MGCVTPRGAQKIFGMKATLLRVPEQGDLGYIYTFADLTDIRRLEQEIRMRDRLLRRGVRLRNAHRRRAPGRDGRCGRFKPKPVCLSYPPLLPSRAP